MPTLYNIFSLGKQNNTVNGFTSPPSKKSRLFSSPTLKKTRGYFTTSPKSSRYKRMATSFSSIGTNTSLPGCRGDACPYHPDNPRTWTVEQVAEYVEATDCKNYATLFLDQVGNNFLYACVSYTRRYVKR